MKLSDLGRVI